MRAPGRSSAEARPAPFSIAHLTISPSRDSIGLEVSSTILPLSSSPRSLPTAGMAWYGTDTTSTSPNFAASRGVPALALAPTSAASFLSCSRSTEENMTWWPALAHTRPSVPPTRPEPTMPTFILPPGAPAARAADGRLPTTSAATPAWRSLRRLFEPAVMSARLTGQEESDYQELAAHGIALRLTAGGWWLAAGL